MVAMTLVHFAILSFRGGARYNYYHYFADKTAIFDVLHALGLTAPALMSGEAAPGGIMETLGYIVHGDRANLAASNVADAGNGIINMIDTGLSVIVILLSPGLARRFGKKAVAIVGFGLAALFSCGFYFLRPDNYVGMMALTALVAISYAPTIPLIWAMFADVADYSEWKNGRRATGMVFATIGFALKLGLAIGTSSVLWLLAYYGYEANQGQTPSTLEGIRSLHSFYIGGAFAVCTLLLILYPLGKKLTYQIAEDLLMRRNQGAVENQ